MNKKWLAAFAAVMALACMGCKAEKIPSYLIVNGTTLVSYTDELPANLVIPKGITKIAGGAFAECDWLKSVTIPGGVKVIGEDVIDDDITLEELNAMDDIDEEDVCVFYNTHVAQKCDDRKRRKGHRRLRIHGVHVACERDHTEKREVNRSYCIRWLRVA